MKREDINSFAQLVKIEELKKLYEKIDENYGVKILTAPTEQTLLVPVKDPISNGSFYAGEVLVTSTIVEVKDTKGWAMVTSFCLAAFAMRANIYEKLSKPTACK